jgi:hypothetical protein
MGSLDLLETAAKESGPLEEMLDWIHCCDGYRVVSAEGYIGTVEIVLYGAAQTPAALAVRTGLFARQLLLVPVEEVLSVSTARSMIVLAESWRPRAAGIGEELVGSE